MRLLSTMTLWLLCPVLVLAGEEVNRPLGVVDSGGHTGPIGQLLFAPDGQTLYSISVDRTIRVWDVRSGRTREVLRPPIYESFGQLSRAALSPDGRFLAVAGNTTQDGNSFEAYLIALHPQARIQHVLKRHTLPITSVCFSANGEQLATGSLDKTVRVWSVASGKDRLLEAGKERITGLAFSPDGKALAVATPAGGRILSVDGSKPEAALSKAGELNDIAWSSDGKTLASACAAPPALGLWNADGSFRKAIDLPGTPLSCRFLAADRVLAAVRDSEKDPSLDRYGAVLLNLENTAEKPSILGLGPVVERRFAGVAIEAGCAAYDAKTDLLAVAGGNDPAITLWKRSDGSQLRKLAGTGSAVWSVGWGYTGQSVAWGDEGKFEDFRRNGTRSLRYTFSFSDPRLQPILEEQYKYARQLPDNPQVEGSVYSGLFYKRSSPILAELFAARSGVTLPGNQTAIASPIKIDGRDPFAAHRIAIHDWQGATAKHPLEGHHGIVNALSVSPRDSRYLLSGSEDQTVRVWKLDEKRLLLSLFRGGDDWVAWTPEGYYTASASGARLLGWHVNQPNQLAHFYPAADFQRSLDLRGIFPHLLRCDDIEKALAAAKHAKDVEANRTLLPIEKILPPQVDRPSVNETVHNSGELEIKARAQAHSPEHPVIEMQLLVDGRDNVVADASRKVAPAEKAEASWKVTLPPGEHVLSVRARTAVSTGLSPEVTKTIRVAAGPRNNAPIKKNNAPIKKPRLHLLTIAISGAVPNPPSGHTPADNAKQLQDVLEQCSKPLFEVQYTRLPEDNPQARRPADRKTILEEINKLVGDMELGDVAIVLYLGAGERDVQGRFYLAPKAADAKAKGLAAAGVGIHELRDALRKSRGFALLLLDCHPLRDDRFAADSGRSLDVPDGTVRQAVESGGVAVLRSSLGEVAGPDTNAPPPGLFAETVAKALAGAADQSRDQLIDLKELGDYVCEQVKKESGGRQRPKLDCSRRAERLILASLTDNPRLPKSEKYELEDNPLVELPPPVPAAKERTDGQDKSPENAVLDLQLPAGSRVSINGVDRGENKRFVFGPIRRGGLQQVDLRIRAAAGKEKQQQILLRAGWEVHLSAAAGDDRPEMVVQTGHTQEIRGVAISGDGRRLLSGGKDRIAILWDLATSRQMRVFRGHTKTVQAAAFSPDGRHVLTGSEDKTAILWETETGKLVRTFEGHRDSVFAVSFHPDGKRIVTGSGDHTAIVWAVDSGEKVATLKGHDGAVHGIAFDHEGKRIVTGSADATAILWETTGQLLHRFEGNHKPIGTVAFSADGRIAAGSADGTAFIWEAATGKERLTWPAHKQQINALAFNADGSQIVTGCADGTAALWSANDGKSIRTFSHSGGVTAVACHPRDKRVVTAATDRTIRLWDVDRANAKPQELQGTVSRVTALAIDRSKGQYVISGSVDRMARLWDLAAGRPVKALAPHKDRVGAVALGPEGRLQLTGCVDGTAQLWQLADPQLLPNGEAAPKSPVHAVAFSPDGKHAVAGCGNGHVRLYDVDAESHSCRLTFTWEAHSDGINAIVFASDGKSFVTASNDATAIRWDATTRKKICEFAANQGDVRAVAISQDGKHVLTGHDSGAAILWDADSGNKILTLPLQGDRVNAVAISSDGQLLLTTSGTTAILWDAGKRRLHELTGHDGEITAAAITPDDRFLLTASEDGTMRLWDLATGAELARLIGLDGGGDWLVLTPDGLFDGSEKGREKVMFRVSAADAPQPVDRYFDLLYRPGLLAAMWSHKRPAAPSREQVVKKGSLVPVVRIRPPAMVVGGVIEKPDITVEVEAADMGGGTQELRLQQEGCSVLGGNEIKEVGRKIKRFDLHLAAGENTLKATAKSADGVESEPAVLVLRYEKPLSKPNLYLLAAGVSSYKDAALRSGVKYAAADAKALVEVFHKRGKKTLYNEVYPHLLLDDKATRKGIADALEEIVGKARNEDVFVLFLAGHGEENEGDYFYIPYEFAAEGANNRAKLKQQGVSIDDLKERLRQLKATKRLLILDTCHAGAGATRFSSSGLPSAAVLRGALERLNKAQGIYALAAASAKEKSKETDDLKHGLFTYAVLAGLRAVTHGPLRGKAIIRGDYVHVRDLSNFACDQLPSLYQAYSDRPVNPVMQVTGGGMDFPLLPAVDP